MSTKTSIKRIAAVAAVALTLGGFSAVSAHATASTAGATVTVSGSTKVSLGDAATLKVSTTLTGTPVVGDTVTVTPTITFVAAVSGSATGLTTTASTLQSGSATAGTLTGVTASNSAAVTTYTASSTTAGSGSYTFVTAAPTVAGTYTITFTPTGSGAGVYLPAVYTLVATTGSTAVVSGTGTSSVSGQSSAATASDIADGAHFANVQVFTGTADKAYSVSSSGVGTLYGTLGASTLPTSASTAGVVTYNNGASVAGGFIVASDANGVAATTGFTAGNNFNFSATSSVAGTQVITVTPINGTSAASTITITWGAAPVVSAQYSTAYLGTGASAASANTTTTSFSAKAVAAGSPNANVAITLNSAASTGINAQPVSVSMTGPGFISLQTGTSATSTTLGRSLVLSATDMAATNQAIVGIYADGSAGTTVVTITSGTTTIGTKTVTFVGAPAKAVVTQNLYIAKAGAQLGGTVTTDNGTTNDGTTVAKTVAFTAEVTDANGNDVTAGSAVKMVSSNSAVITAGQCAENATYSGNFECSVYGASGAVSGQSATITFEVYNATTAAYDILATPLTFSIGKSAYTVALSTDATSYDALAPVQLIATVKDSAGNAAADSDVALFGATLTSSTQLGGATLPGTTAVTVINGKHTFKGFYAPLAAKSFAISGTEGLSGLLGAITTGDVTAVGDSSAQAAIDAAQEATDAANAAYDAANNAMDSADAATAAAQDAADNASAALAAVTSLSATVAKLVKSVAAIAAALAKVQKKIGA